MSNEDLGLFTVDGRNVYRPGDTLELSVLWALAEKPTSLEVRLFWYTRGRGIEDVEVIATEPIASTDAAGETKVRFTLPAGPWSFGGKLVSVVWAAELVAEPGGRAARCEFTLSPNGAEIVPGG